MCSGLRTSSVARGDVGFVYMTARKDEHQHRSSRNFFFNLDVTEKGVFAKQSAAVLLVMYSINKPEDESLRGG